VKQVAEELQVRYAPEMDCSEPHEQTQIKRLADAIYRDKVLRARAEDPVQKLLDGFELFTIGLEMTKLDVIGKIGTSDETAVQDALHRRFERVRKVREAGHYRPL
jgi:hypothetical protein